MSACSIAECASRSHARGYCTKHYRRFMTTGDPLKVIVPHGRGRTRLIEPTYGAVHKRLERERGRASEHLCAACGNRAQEWSYDGGDPNELTEVLEKRPIKYTTDLERYSPRCRKCHRHLDESLCRNRNEKGQWAS